MSPASRRVGWWLTAWAAMLLVTVMIGGITRLTDSGLSITEWKPVSGVLPPLDRASWEEAFAKYREIPEYRLEHPTMDLAQFRRIYLWEYFHRLWARLVGLALLVPMVVFWRRGDLDRRLKGRAVALLALLGAQGAMGWFMVQSGLTIRTDVSHYRLAAHLALALMIVALTVATATRLVVSERAVAGSTLPAWPARGFAGLVFFTAIAGALVAGLDAGKVFNEFPMMGGRWIPPGYGRLTPWWANLVDDVVAVQFHHRILAVVTAAAGLGLGWAAIRRGSAAGRRLGVAITVTVVAQFTLGVATLLRSVPTALAVAHQGTAVVLFGLAVALVAVQVRSASFDPDPRPD